MPKENTILNTFIFEDAVPAVSEGSNQMFNVPNPPSEIQGVTVEGVEAAVRAYEERTRASFRLLPAAVRAKAVSLLS